MKRTFLNSKIHGASVTGADLHYEGSFGIDVNVLKAVGILPNEQIHVYNVTNGNRFVTYALPKPAFSKIMCANGACARLVSIGDTVIICTFAELEEREFENHKPKILFFDEQNNYSFTPFHASEGVDSLVTSG